MAGVQAPPTAEQMNHAMGGPVSPRYASSGTLASSSFYDLSNRRVRCWCHEWWHATQPKLLADPKEDLILLDRSWIDLGTNKPWPMNWRRAAIHSGRHLRVVGENLNMR